MSAIDGLAAFYAARLDEEEAAAVLAARGIWGQWRQDDPLRYPGAISSIGGPVVYDEGAPDEYAAAHIVIHDPASVLRDVAVKRAILADCVRAIGPDRELSRYASPRVPYDAPHANLAYRTLRSLASAYDTHPDYPQETLS